MPIRIAFVPCRLINNRFDLPDNPFDIMGEGAAVGIAQHNGVRSAFAAAATLLPAYSGLSMYPSKKCSAS
jgi:hypothetical protein